MLVCFFRDVNLFYPLDKRVPHGFFFYVPRRLIENAFYYYLIWKLAIVLYLRQMILNVVHINRK
jgi:hypothetical protein